MTLLACTGAGAIELDRGSQDLVVAPAMSLESCDTRVSPGSEFQVLILFYDYCS
jgi:hypothetical protein